MTPYDVPELVLRIRPGEPPRVHLSAESPADEAMLVDELLGRDGLAREVATAVAAALDARRAGS